MDQFIKVIKKYLKSRLGVVALSFGLMVPVVVSAVGVSVDIGRSYLVKERLSHALDAAALAAAANASEDDAVVKQKVKDFLNANYPEGKLGTIEDIKIVNTPTTLTVDATAQLDTSFMRVAGIKTIDVAETAEVTKEIKAIEVVLVMDITGSMSTNNNIATLRTAASNFVTTMFDRVTNTDDIKIGLTPFSSSVNVGPYGLGKTPTGTNYNGGTKFVTNPSNLTYSATDTSKWNGCILEETTTGNDTKDYAGPWKMYRYCRKDDGTVIPNCDTTYNSKTKVYTANQNQNYQCPATPITPMTNDKTTLLNSIGTLKALGNTYINIGLVWGYRMISPEQQFTEGAPWDDDKWKKAVILMTDGVNTMNSYYSVYGPTADHNITASNLDTKMLQVCTDMKSKGILLYTITFDKGVNAYTKNLFKQCATDPSMWYDAPTQSKLIEVYQTIAKELSNLHLSK